MESELEEITEAEKINAFIEAWMTDVHTAQPCVVESYDKDAGTVEAIPALNRALPDGAGNWLSESLPKLGPIPILWPRTGDFEITWPLKKGDFGAIFFAERNIGAWRALGQQSDPGDLGMHTLDGAFFAPGLCPNKAPPKVADASNMIVGSATDGPSRIELKPTGGINLGAGATKGVARNGDKVNLGTVAVTAGVGGFLLSIVHVSPGGITTTFNVATPGPFPLEGAIKEGSANIKAVD